MNATTPLMRHRMTQRCALGPSCSQHNSLDFLASAVNRPVGKLGKFFDGEHDAIVEVETFERVQQLLAAKSCGRSPRRGGR